MGCKTDFNPKISKLNFKTFKTKTMKQATQKTDYNNTVNQQIKSEFVQREVYCNVNSLVEYCLKQGYEDRESPVNYDDIENLYYLDRENIINDILRDFDKKKDDFISFLNTADLSNKKIKTKKNIEDYLNSLDDDELKIFCEEFGYSCEEEMTEVYEWWAVSGYLYKQLKERKETVCDAGSCYIWGRATTGQAILLDGVISRICSDMEILDGQSHSWAKK